MIAKPFDLPGCRCKVVHILFSQRPSPGLAACLHSVLVLCHGSISSSPARGAVGLFVRQSALSPASYKNPAFRLAPPPALRGASPARANSPEELNISVSTELRKKITAQVIENKDEIKCGRS